MKKASCVLILTFAIYLDFVELRWPHRKNAVHPSIIHLYNVHYSEIRSNPPLGCPLRAGSVEGAIDQSGQYLFGVIGLGQLCPILAEIDHGNIFGRVKVRINWDADPAIANETEPMLREDPLCQFFGLTNSQATYHLVRVIVHQ